MPTSRIRSLAAALGAIVALVSVAVPAEAVVGRVRRAPLELSVFGPTQPLTETAWLVNRVGDNRRFDLGSESLLAWLERYVEPARNRTPEWRSFWQGRYGRNNLQLYPKLSWLRSLEAVDDVNAVDDANAVADVNAVADANATDSGVDDAPAERFALADRFRFELRGPALAQPFDFSRAEVLPDWSLGVQAPEPEFLGVTQRKSCPRWKEPRAVSVVRYDGAEWARLPLIDCQGAIAPDALDRLSVLARPPSTPKPDLPLPLEPAQGTPAGEWLPRVKLLHPRLIWAVQRIALAFPNRSIFIMSGYRRDAHNSYHQQGRALDLYVTGVDDADLFRFCHTLNDVGCGFYPNSKFVHVDVRPFGTHRVAWVDVSLPGAPSEYVTSWPGILPNPEELSAGGSAE